MMAKSERERLSSIALAHLMPPKFAGGSWTLNPDNLADAILAAGFGDVAQARAEAWFEGHDEGFCYARAEIPGDTPYRTPSANGGEG